jgi:hypothetical protein
VSEDCGCVRETSDEHDVITSLCAHHAHVASLADHRARSVLDQELDQTIREACGGKRSKRIWRIEP